jgi:hypothetical protein
MNKRDFKKGVDELARKGASGEISSLDIGRLYRGLCAEYLKDHSELPEGYC